MRATLTTKGQITVPKPIRDRLHLRPGDRVEFILTEDGHVEFVPATLPITSLKGMLPGPPAVASLKDMDNAIAKGASRS